MTTTSKTLQLLQAWVQSAPKRTEKVVKLLADSGIDAEELEKELALKIAKPEPASATIPTFDPAIKRPCSPMLAERLRFAGNIGDANEKWPGLKDMQKAMATKRLQGAIKSLRDDWENSAPARLAPGQLGLFGYSMDEDTDLTLLVWETDDAAEPKLVRYFGQSERVFKHLDAFLKWANT